MTYICVHCQRQFTTDIDIAECERLCRNCRSGYEQLQLECASLPAPKSILTFALRRTHAIKRHVILEPPTSFAGLLSWLLAHPHVLITIPGQIGLLGSPEAAAFLSYDCETLWFRGWNFLTAVPAPLSDPGLVFDSSGFSSYGPDGQIRVEYQP